MNRKQTGAAAAWLKKRRVSLFSLAALILVAALAFQGRRESDPLFEKNSHFTLSAEVLAGSEPQVDFSPYFPEQSYETDRFSFDSTGCDFTKEGAVYTLPLFYNGKQTSADLKLTVVAAEQSLPGLEESVKSNQKIEAAIP